MSYLVTSTPPPMRGRAYSFGQAGSGYPATPYSGYNSLPMQSPYYNNPGMARSATYYIAPSVYGGRSRSHSRPRQSHRSHSHQRHGHHRRSRSHQRPSTHVRVFPSLCWPWLLMNLYFSTPHIATRRPRVLLTRALPWTAPLHWASAYSTSSALGIATATPTDMAVHLTVVAGPSTSTKICAFVR